MKGLQLSNISPIANYISNLLYTFFATVIYSETAVIQDPDGTCNNSYWDVMQKETWGRIGVYSRLYFNHLAADALEHQHLSTQKFCKYCYDHVL